MTEIGPRTNSVTRSSLDKDESFEHCETLIPILGDQLSSKIASLRDADRKHAVILMMEVKEEATYVRHHKAKIAFVFAAMRHHADRLRRDGWRVDYTFFNDPDSAGSFTAELARAFERHRPSRIVVTEPGEWRVAEMMRAWQRQFDIPVEIRSDDRFVASHREFAAWAKDRKDLRMEWFYRQMRRKTGLLMNGDEPEGGQWNFDKQNLKPARNDLLMPKPLSFPSDHITTDVLNVVESNFGDHPGTLDAFDYAVTAQDAERQADHFMKHALGNFGDYQDAMLSGERYLWHSILSPYINVGLLDPLDLCRRAESEYKAGRASLNSVEGYIRQIIGWREYVRGIYWLEGPTYTTRNFLNATRALPEFYWTGETDMHCMAEALSQTLETAHAHHIQRLMVTGNFALLIGADPHEVHRWYLEIYVDAFEWVELPNTLGMSQFADGGLLGSKPYAASGSYISRMSDYCENCRFDVKKRVGDGACPFNSLYWDFLARNRDKLGDNRRLAISYRTWDRMDRLDKVALRKQASHFLSTLDGQNQ